MTDATYATLLDAVFAMDAYEHNSNDGSWSDDLAAFFSLDDNELGNYTLIDVSAGEEQLSNNFFAMAYSSSGQTIISYRGTSNLFGSNFVNGDIYNGYGVGAGFPGGPDAMNAVAFYQEVADLLDDPWRGATDITLVGHSLGGGLAGYVGAIYGLKGDLFDNMTFNAAAASAYSQSLPSQNIGDTADQIEIPGNVTLKEKIYGDQSPYPNNLSRLKAYATTGELLSVILPLRFFQTPRVQYVASYGGPRDIVDLHSMSLLTLLLYADENRLTDWHDIGKPFVNALFDNRLSQAVMGKNSQGAAFTAAEMRSTIAYSAINQGYEPFGTTALQSLFTDADVLGGLQSAGQFTGYLAPAPNLPGAPSGMSAAVALTEIGVQFAGDQAAAANTDATLAQGALELDGSVLKVDLDPSEWTSTFQQSSTGATTTSIVGVGDLFNSVLANVAAGMSAEDPTYAWVASNAAGLSASMLKQLNKITEIDISLDGSDLSAAGTLPAAHGGGAGGALLIGASGQGSITGSDKGNDIIIGGSTVTTGKGKDIILAGGSETIEVGGGNSRILADSSAVNFTMNYSDASANGTDVIIGNLSGGDTFTFNHAGKAAFTVVWAGSGNDTFNINTDSPDDTVNVVELNMSGISGGNLANLDAQKLEKYVGTGDGTIVILNASASDKLLYNGEAIETPQAVLNSIGSSTTNSGGADGDASVVFDQTGGLPTVGPDPKNPLQYLTLQKQNAYIQEAYDTTLAEDEPHQYALLTGLGLNGADAARMAHDFALQDAAVAAVNTSLDIQYYEQTHEMGHNTWNMASSKSETYVLANKDYVFNQQGATLSLQHYETKTVTTSGSSGLSPLSDWQYTWEKTTYQQVVGSGGLNLVNFNSGDFGIQLPQSSGKGWEVDKSTEYEVLQGWSTGYQIGGQIIGTTPSSLGAVLSNYNHRTVLPDSGISSDPVPRPTVDLSSYLLDSSSSDPTNVSVAFFNANQPLLDGQFYGYTVLDTAANVSSALDALNADSKLTGITLTDSGTPTLTLTSAQMFNDTGALSAITNASYDIAIEDTAANVSQVLDALNANAAVISIDLIGAGTPSLTLTAMQALMDGAALAKISNASYAIAISDTAGDVAETIDELNSDAAVSSVTLVDSGTPTLALSVAQILGDTRVLGEITNAAYGITVEDTAANILGNAAALGSNARVTGANVFDTAANVLNNGAALDSSALVTSITVVDTATNILGNLTTFQADSKITTMVVVDTAANVLANASALTGVSKLTGIGVADTAADVAGNIDALNADAAVDWVELTDSATPVLTLTSAQAVNDTNLLGRIANVTYAIDVADTATAVAENIDALARVAKLASVTLTDPGTPTLTLTAAQAADDASVIALISNANAGIVVSDTAANVVAQLDALNADAKISAITLTDAGTPTLTLTVAQLLGDATAVGKINAANVDIVVSDTAADISANFDALNTDAALSSITLTDSGTPILVLTAAQADNTALLAKISNANYTIAIFDSVANILADAGSLASNGKVTSINAIDTVADVLANSAGLAGAGSTSQLILDTAANVAANIDAIKADTSIRAISLTDSGTPTLSLTVAQTIGDASVLGLIANSTFAIHVSGTAADVSASANSLAANSLISAVTLTDAGVPALSLNVEDVTGGGEFLAKITNTIYTISIQGDAATVAAHLDALNANAAVSAITLTDTAASGPGGGEGGEGASAQGPVLDLSVAQVVGDTRALAAITNAEFTISATGTATDVANNIGVLEADPHVTDISIVDTAANILSNAASWSGVSLVSSVVVADTAANVLANEDALAQLPVLTAVNVLDTAANVTAEMDALSADYAIRQITLSDANPVLTLTAQQASDDWRVLSDITNPSYAIRIVDTAANVSTYLGGFANDFGLTSITLTDSGTPTLELDPYWLQTGLLGKITNSNYTIALADGSNLSVSEFLAAQSVLDGISGGFAISDGAAQVSAQIDAINADTHVTSITLTDYWQTPNLALSVAQVIGDTQALGKIDGDYTISVTDTASSILANAQVLADNSNVTSVTVSDSAAGVLSALNDFAGITSAIVVDTAANVIANQSALAALAIPVSIQVQDTAADVSSVFDQLNADSAISAIALSDANPVLTLTAAQAVDDAGALAEIVDPFGVDIVDTAAHVSQYLDALSGLSELDAISLTDSAHLSVSLSVAEAAQDSAALSLLSNATYDIAIVDTAANIESNLDGLNVEQNISAITVQGAGPIIVSAQQAVQDAAVIAKITNATVDVVATENLSVTEFLSEQAEIDSAGLSVTIRDTASVVAGDLGGLQADGNVSGITLSDAGVPTLTLTAAQVLGDASILGAIVNPSYAIAISDTGAAVGASFAALDGISQIQSITLSDSGPIPLTIADYETADSLLGKVTNFAGVTITDTANNIQTDLDALNADPRVVSIAITDATGSDIDLTVAQALTELGKITTPSYGIVIEDTVDNFAGHIDALSAIGNVRQVVAYIPYVGIAPIPLTVAEALRNRAFLAKGEQSSFSGLLPVPISIVDSAANVAAAFDVLNRDAGIGAITLTDQGVPVLNLTTAQVSDDTSALSKISGSYTINIIQPIAGVSVAEFLANQASLDAGGYFTISDQSQAISQAFDGLDADWHVTGITVTDGVPLTLTTAQALNDTYALAAVGNPPLGVADTAANISANFDALVRDASVSSLTLTDAGTPTLTLTAAQLFGDRQLFGEITNPQYQIAVVDTAANVASSLGNIDANPDVTSVTLTGSDPLTLWVEDLETYASVIGKITNPDLSITVLGAPYNIDQIVSELDALNSDPRVSSIELLFSPSLTLTVAQTIDDATARSKITGAYTIAIKDSAANVAAQFDALNGTTNIASIDLTDGGVPTLVLTTVQVQNDTNALSKVINEPYVLGIVGTGSETITISQPLQLSNFAYDATNGDWQVDGYGLADALSSIAAVVDSTGQRFLLVGGGSEYTAPDAAVTAAANGDIVLLTPGSDAGSVGTDGKTITVEDVSAVGSAPDTVPPLVTITSPPIATASASGTWSPNTITGKAVAYGTAIVAGQTVTLTDNGNALATATIGADGTFAANVTLAYEGANSIVASVTDSFGNTGTSAPVVDLLDDIPPTVTITSPAVTTVDATQTITGTVVSGGVATVDGPNAILLDNGQLLAGITVQADGSFSVTVTLPNQGTNSLVVATSDNYGNFAESAPVVDTLDSEVPTLSILTAAQDTNEASLYIVGVDSALGQTVTLTDNGTVIGTAVSGTYGFFMTTVTLSEGDNSIVASVVDGYGDTITSDPVVYTLDDIAPTVTISSAAESSGVAAQTITGTVVSGGAASVVGQTVTVTDNGTTLVTTTVQADGSFSAALTLPFPGTNTIVATVTDTFGNTGSATVVDTLTDAPSVSITSPAEASNAAGQTITGTVVAGGTATVVGQTVTLTDNGAALATATVQSDGTFSATVTLPNQGANSIVATVTDSNGNTGSSAAVVDTLDTIAPTIAITSAAEVSDAAGQAISGTVSSGGTATVAGQTVTLTDNGATLGTATVQADGTFSANVTLPNPGANTVVATVTDSYGNAGASAPVVDTLDTGTTADFSSVQSSAAVLGFSNGSWTVTMGGQTSTLRNVERVQFADRAFALVDQSGAGVGGYQTLQAAVGQAAGGDTILIAPGSYTETVTIAGKALDLEGLGGVTLHGSITESGTLNGALTIDGLSIDATGQQYGVLVSANSTNYAGSVTLNHASIENAKLNGFAYIEAGNGSTPTHTDTVGSISILNSTFSGNATQTTGANGRGDILLYGYNGNLTVDGVTIQDPGAGAQKAIQMRGVQTSANTVNVGPYQPAGDVSLANLTVSGNYAQDLLAFYRIAEFNSLSTSDVSLNAAAPWGLFNFDEVGGTIDLSNGISATNLAAGAPVAVEQGLSSNDTLIGTSGNDVLVGNGGFDTLSGGAGHNTYVVSASPGQTTINASTASGATNELDFVGGITNENLWFQQSGNDLNIDLLGTSTQVDVSNWFANSTNQLQEISAGGLKIDTQVSQLVQAMATYSGNNSGFDPAAGSATAPNDTNLQTTLAAAWHA